MSEYLWNKVENWSDLNKWEHCYAELDSKGTLTHIQPSGRNYCQGAHYKSSDPYNISGTKRLRWIFSNGHGHILNEKDKEIKYFRTYTAVILFPTVNHYDTEKRRFVKIWSGRELPKLLFRRSQSAFDRSVKSNYQKSPYIESAYVDEKDSDKITVPKDFKSLMMLEYEFLLNEIERWKKGEYTEQFTQNLTRRE